VTVLWAPGDPARTRVGAWLTDQGRSTDYGAAWEWSVSDLPGFWDAVVSGLGVHWRAEPTEVLASAAMPGAMWFPGGALNYAEHAVGGGGGLVSVSATRPTVTLSHTDLVSQVARVATGLRNLGVRRGDRVAAYLPNIAEAVVAFLASASLGAIWSSCPPEFGVRGVVDRFAQIEPAVLLAADGYRHRGRDISRRAEVAEIRAALPTLRATVSVPYLGEGVPDAVPWHGLTATPVPWGEHPAAYRRSWLSGYTQAISARLWEAERSAVKAAPGAALTADRSASHSRADIACV